jgi:hypothetical protein
MYLCLDLSSKCTGWCKFSKDWKLMEKGRISPDTELTPYLKIHFVSEKVEQLFPNVEELLIEDSYIGIDPRVGIFLARLNGAIGEKWVSHKFKEPKLLNARHIRTLLGMKGNARKPDLQLYVIKNYEWLKEDKIKFFEKQLAKLEQELKEKKISKGKLATKLKNITLELDKLTGVGEDTADSIIVGLGYQKEKEGLSL